MRAEIRLAGFGGQGIVLAGHIIGKAAALYDDHYATFAQSYGPEARGGACSAEVVISDEPIDYPLVGQPEYLALMSQEALLKYGDERAGCTAVLVDDDLVHLDDAAPGLYRIPATRLAQNLGNRIAANIVMVGFFAAVTGIISRGAAEAALRSTVREKTLALNLKALATGYEYPFPLASPAVPRGRQGDQELENRGRAVLVPFVSHSGSDTEVVG
ncbi:MAG: 2-oxoacid:acceptor oxidoreductase family protein [Chloroflexi bacterium]|nr:2-oxoacid:acceptor oxidoreductase family protein [Chloroflexota bacterium]